MTGVLDRILALFRENGVESVRVILLYGAEKAFGFFITRSTTLIARIRIWLAGGKVGKGFVVRGWIQMHISPTGRIRIGENVRMNSGFGNNAVGGFRRMGIWVGPKGILTIGNNVGISSSTIVCMREIVIDDDVMIGGDCKIYDTDFHSVSAKMRLSRPDQGVKTSPVTLKRASFIGGHSILLKGVNVGKEAVIGAGSVVTKNIPDAEIWGGNPAKFIGCVDTPEKKQNS